MRCNQVLQWHCLFFLFPLFAVADFVDLERSLKGCRNGELNTKSSHRSKGVTSKGEELPGSKADHLARFYPYIADDAALRHQYLEDATYATVEQILAIASLEDEDTRMWLMPQELFDILANPPATHPALDWNAIDGSVDFFQRFPRLRYNRDNYSLLTRSMRTRLVEKSIADPEWPQTISWSVPKYWRRIDYGMAWVWELRLDAVLAGDVADLEFSKSRSWEMLTMQAQQVLMSGSSQDKSELRIYLDPVFGRLSGELALQGQEEKSMPVGVDKVINLFHRLLVLEHLCRISAQDVSTAMLSGYRTGFLRRLGILPAARDSKIRGDGLQSTILLSMAGSLFPRDPERYKTAIQLWKRVLQHYSSKPAVFNIYMLVFTVYGGVLDSSELLDGLKGTIGLFIPMDISWRHIRDLIQALSRCNRPHQESIQFLLTILPAHRQLETAVTLDKSFTLHKQVIEGVSREHVLEFVRKYLDQRYWTMNISSVSRSNERKLLGYTSRNGLEIFKNKIIQTCHGARIPELDLSLPYLVERILNACSGEAMTVAKEASTCDPPKDIISCPISRPETDATSTDYGAANIVFLTELFSRLYLQY